MSYKISSEDTKLKNWFCSDNSHSLLRILQLYGGAVRGLKPFVIHFNYPITVISGKNGSGKTTLLALAACAFHNMEKGFKLTNRKLPYYTFSDFFIQSKEEISPEGIEIRYYIAYDKWLADNGKDTEEGIFYQSLTKSQGGKWTSYGKRIKRTVVFFGIDRVVPHSEKSVSKSYRSSFVSLMKNGCEEKVQRSVSKVLGIEYEEFHFKSHSKYRLPFVKRGALSYSGFNMGAGENALFEIFYNLHACPEGTLAIIDEIELGLHQQAQQRLMKELKAICSERKIQIICTTHSPAILSEIPPIGRFYIENHFGKTDIIPGISSEFAAGKLSGLASEELTIFVEDGVAADILRATFNQELRSRIVVIPIGSDAAVITLLAGMRKSGRGENIIAVLDGDKINDLNKKHQLFLRKIESYENKDLELEWIKIRLFALPGGTWPEAWIMSILKKSVSPELVKILGSTKEHIISCAVDAELAGKHSEFFSLASGLHMDVEYLKKIISSHIAEVCQEEFSSLLNSISSLLKA